MICFWPAPEVYNGWLATFCCTSFLWPYCCSVRNSRAASQAIFLSSSAEHSPPPPPTPRAFSFFPPLYYQLPLAFRLVSALHTLQSVLLWCYNIAVLKWAKLHCNTISIIFLNGGCLQDNLRRVVGRVNVCHWQLKMVVWQETKFANGNSSVENGKDSPSKKL